MIRFNEHHYSDLWERQEFYKKALGEPADPYNHYLNMIGLVLASCDPTKIRFPYSIEVKQELIKILMLAQADAVRSRLDVSSLKAPEEVPDKKSFLNKLFKKKKHD